MQAVSNQESRARCCVGVVVVVGPEAEADQSNTHTLTAKFGLSFRTPSVDRG